MRFPALADFGRNRHRLQACGDYSSSFFTYCRHISAASVDLPPHRAMTIRLRASSFTTRGPPLHSSLPRLLLLLPQMEEARVCSLFIPQPP
jgi:hypothetical protein